MSIVKVNGINIEYTVIGQGEPLVMIMGLGASQSLWEPQIADFKQHYQLITFDNRGAGKSDKQNRLYDIKTMADDVIGLMDHLGIAKANILGVSMGGMIAQELAINYSDRVSKLILASTYACVDQPGSGATQEVIQMAKLPLSKIGICFIYLAYNKPFNRLIIILKIMLRSKFRNKSDKTGGKDGFMGQIGACLKHNTLDKLHLIKATTLVITGSKDRVIKPSSSEVIANLIPDTKLVIIKNGSHSFHAEMKKDFNQTVLNFLLYG
jgi:pimeloyl-ACP methyl ester carboxylesterase